MKNENRYLIGVDLDDTLLDQNKDISDLTKEIISRLHEEGNEVILNSGRPFQGVIPFVKRLGLPLPIIANNGESIVTFEDDLYTVKDYQVFPMDQKSIMALLQESLSYLDNVRMTSFYDFYSLDERKTPFWVIHRDPRVTFHSGWEDLSRAEAIMDAEFTMLKKDADHFALSLSRYPLLKAIRWRGDEVYDTFEVSAVGVDKGTTLLKLAKIMGISPLHTMGFGDQLNDLPLLEKVRYPVSMKNARPELKEKIPEATEEDCNHDGVARYLRKFFHL